MNKTVLTGLNNIATGLPPGSLRALVIVGIIAALIAVFLIVSIFAKKKKARNVTVIKTDDKFKAYLTGGIRKDGSNLSMVNAVTSILFKKENGEEFTLQASEDKARGLQEGVKGTVIYSNGKLIRFIKEE